ncbi:MAG TPA: hypothetical protein EYP91_07760 [Gammaproteobacteria bacterium]|nr:hypothetical protein [Gammaproteobacteria bacterium]
MNTTNQKPTGDETGFFRRHPIIRWIAIVWFVAALIKWFANQAQLLSSNRSPLKVEPHQFKEHYQDRQTVRKRRRNKTRHALFQ